MRPGTHGLRGLFIALVASAIACGRQGPAAPVQIRTPNPDVGVDALAARQKAQREAVNGSQVPHDFQFSDKLARWAGVVCEFGRRTNARSFPALAKSAAGTNIHRVSRR